MSLNPKIKLGVGAYLFVPTSFLDIAPDRIVRSKVAERLRTRRFESTSSTKLEVQTVLWALEHYRKECKVSGPGKLYVYSDSQCVAGLLRRRPGLEANCYRSSGTNRLLENASLYRKYFEFHDELGFEIIKVSGHSRSCSNDTFHRIFSFVDREVRKALKLWMRELEVDSIESHTCITIKKGTPL